MRSIEEILGLETPGVLSLVGGGGKTSLMYGLAHRLAQAGKRVLTTTTTKIMVPSADQSGTLIVTPDPDAVLKQALSCRDASLHVTAAAEHYQPGKLRGFPPEVIDWFWSSGMFDWILVEADGAARRPLKAPAAHEPVLAATTTLLVAVAGLEVVGAPFTDDLVFRTQLAQPLLDLAPGATITEAALARLIAHPLGFFKDAAPETRRFVFLNKADTPARRAAAAGVAQELRQLAPVAESLLVGQALNGIRLHAEHRLEESA